MITLFSVLDAIMKAWHNQRLGVDVCFEFTYRWLEIQKNNIWCLG